MRQHPAHDAVRPLTVLQDLIQVRAQIRRDGIGVLRILRLQGGALRSEEFVEFFEQVPRKDRKIGDEIER
jgi:hypothetical protein